MTLYLNRRAATDRGWGRSPRPGGRSGAARRCRVQGLLIAALSINAAGIVSAQQAMDQFRVLPIPEGILIEPRQAGQAIRSLTYKTSLHSKIEIDEFAQNLCSATPREAYVEFHPQSFLQKLRGTADATVTC